MSARRPSSASLTQTPAVICMAETRIMPSRMPLLRSALSTCGVILRYSRCCAVFIVRYSVWNLIPRSYNWTDGDNPGTAAPRRRRTSAAEVDERVFDAARLCGGSRGQHGRRVGAGAGRPERLFGGGARWEIGR